MNPTLAHVPALAAALTDPAATATQVARALGPAEDPTGWGEQLTIAQPSVPGVAMATVLCDPPLARPAILTLYLTAPLARAEVLAALGPGLRRLAEDGRRETLHPLIPKRCTVIARGDEETVEELVLRRDG